MVLHDTNPIVMNVDVHDHPYDGCGAKLMPSGPGLSLTGIDSLGRAPEGTDLLLVNATAFTVTVAHDNVNSAEGNRFYNEGGSDYLIPAYGQLRGVRVESVSGRVGWWMK